MPLSMQKTLLRAPLKLLVNDRISQIVRENEVFKDKL